MKKKTCPKCKRSKDITAFYSEAKRPGKLAGWCKGCKRKQSNAYYHSDKARAARVEYKAWLAERRARDRAILDAAHAADPIAAAVDEGIL